MKAREVWVMIFKKIGYFNRGYGLVTENPNIVRLSNGIDAMIRGTQARLNLRSGLSKLIEHLGNNEDFQQVDGNDKKSGAT